MSLVAEASAGLRRSLPPARASRGLVVASLAVCAVMVTPLAYLALRAAEADASSWDLILRMRTVWLTLRTLGLAAAVTIAAVAVGVPLAWLTTRTDLPGRRAWAVLVSLPLVIPSYVGAFALIAAFGPRGMLQQLLEAPLGVERLPDITGFPGAFIALTLFTYPYVFLLVSAGIKGLDPSIEDASRSLAHTRWTTFRRVTLPSLRPSIAAGGLLVALYALHDFGAVSLMRFPAFTQAIYLQYKGAFDRTPAALLSLMLVGLALAVLVLEQRARGRARYYRSGAGTARRVTPIELGKWTWPSLVLCGSVTLFALVGPLAVIVFWLIRGFAAGTDIELTLAPAVGSLVVASAAALAAVASAFPIARLVARHQGGFTRSVERLSYTGYALPGIVAALAFVFFASNFAPWLYQSLPLVVIAYVVLFLPQATEPLRGALMQMGPRVEEAGRALGRTRRHVYLSVVAPLIARGALAGAALVFLTSMKELPATLLLRPTGFDTLATSIWTGAAAGLYSKAAAPALLLIAICAVPLYVLVRRVEVEKIEVPAE
ncbi:MAG TPA: iron ABC transporter permease [Actinomycetota bacterium]|nr:iron ABC transporter permease [Actinomycetota bacterium]